MIDLRKDRSTDEIAAELLGQIDLTGFAVLIGEMTKELSDVVADSGRALLGEIGIETGDPIFNTVDWAALKFAQQRAAELVGMRLADDGTFVTNPDAEWAITDGTRSLLRSTVSQAIEEGWSPGQLREAIVSSTAFSTQRALNIARSETARAHGVGGFEAAKASGVVETKEALLGSEHSDKDEDECDDNADDGEIPIDQAFSGSGAMQAEGSHPNCVCSTLYHVGEVD